MAKALKFEQAQTGFELFCDFRGWVCWKFIFNPQNKQQYLGVCTDKEGKDQYYLISESGRYYKFISEKNWQEVSLDYKKEGKSDEC